MREIPLGVPCPSGHYSALELMIVNARHGAFGNSGRTLLAVSAAGTQAVHVFELDTFAGVQAALQQRGRLVSKFADPVGPVAGPEDEEEQQQEQQQQQQEQQTQPMLQQQQRLGGQASMRQPGVMLQGQGQPAAAGHTSGVQDTGRQEDDEELTGDEEEEDDGVNGGVQHAHVRLLQMQQELRQEAQQQRQRR